MQVYRAIKYIRLSYTDDKSTESDSVANQRKLIDNYIAQHPEIEVVDEKIDDGYSGVLFDRPAFKEMMELIKEGKVNCVIVKDLSRLGREYIETGRYMRRVFPAYGVRFIAINDNVDTLNDTGDDLTVSVKNIMNEAYALDIGRKIKAQARQAMKDGEYIGARAPYGYRKAPENCHKLLIDPEAAEVVFQIFQWAYEHVGMNDIARRLNEQGIQTPSHRKRATGEITHENLVGSGKWQTRTVAKILDSKVYTGDLVQGKTKIVDHQQVQADEDNLIIATNTHEAIISHEVFEAVKAYRRQVCEESKAHEVDPYTPNIFKGKVFCAHCGGSLHRQRNKRKKGPVFHCLTKSRVDKNGCLGVSVTEKDLLAAVVAILQQELTVALGNYSFVSEAEVKRQKERDDLKAGISAKKQEIDRNRRFVRGLYENFVQKVLTSEEYFTMKKDYEAVIAKLSDETSTLENGLAVMDDQLAKYKELEQDAKVLEKDHTLTAALIDRLIERIEITHDKEIRVSFRFKSEFEEYGKAVEQCRNL